MSRVLIDARGLKCPRPTLEMTIKAKNIDVGGVMEVIADCPSFEKDVRGWCQRMKKVLIWIRKEEDFHRCQIQF